eukprot:TRINITY_DN28143_c0_g1_i1.p1 TRINITY_DN28143_c0_g1~~TRINITY_DN28143_c0_g1_i1.p1  ORF type:complete len:263 (+),score=24.12 TRINITY_DN28143_c0_g1_i1:53-790(+)
MPSAQRWFLRGCAAAYVAVVCLGQPSPVPADDDDDDSDTWRTAALVGLVLVALAAVAVAVVVCAKRGRKASFVAVGSPEDPPPRTASYKDIDGRSRNASKPPAPGGSFALERSQTLYQPNATLRSIGSWGVSPPQPALNMSSTRYTPPPMALAPPPAPSIREHFGYEDSVSPEDSISQVCVPTRAPPAAKAVHQPPALSGACRPYNSASAPHTASRNNSKPPTQQGQLQSLRPHGGSMRIVRLGH